MHRTRVGTLALVMGASGALGWTIAWALERRGTYLPAVPWTVDAAILVLAGIVLWAGLAVRSYQRGGRPGLDGLRAARTVVLAKAAALTGALLTGWYVAQVLLLVGDWSIEARRDKAVAALVAAMVAILLMAVGLVVERWCQIPPPDPTDPEGRVSPPGSEAPA